MKKILVSDLKKGDKFTKPVYLDKSTVFVASQTPITEADLERLKKFNVAELYCDGEKIGSSTEGSSKHQNPLYSDDKLPFLDQSEEGLRVKNIYDRVIHNRYEFDSLYSECLNEIQAAYKQISEGKNFEIQKFRSIGEKIVDFSKSHYDILGLYLNTKQHSGYFLYNHVVHSTLFSVMLGCFMDFTRPKLIDLCLGSMMADIGMILVPEHILVKQEKLDENEFKEVKKHTLIGYQVLTQRVKLKNSLAIISLQHHENFDGTGYPQKLIGNSIEEFARIYAVADVYSALTSKRPYRLAFLPHQAMKMMIGEMVNRFDLRMVKLFLSTQSMYPLGSYVELSDGRVGMVVDSNRDKPIRPTVRIIKESGGQRIRTLQFCNLAQDTQIYISAPVDPSLAN